MKEIDLKAHTCILKTDMIAHTCMKLYVRTTYLCAPHEPQHVCTSWPPASLWTLLRTCVCVCVVCIYVMYIVMDFFVHVYVYVCIVCMCMYLFMCVLYVCVCIYLCMSLYYRSMPFPICFFSSFVKFQYPLHENENTHWQTAYIYPHIQCRTYSLVFRSGPSRQTQEGRHAASATTHYLNA
jgi:hypothetical protein